VPPVLFPRASLKTNERAISVVGSRSASKPALELAATVAAGLVDRGLTVVSGLATGIDSAAHHATLDAKRSFTARNGGGT
jgi:DNA processing protein